MSGILTKLSYKQLQTIKHAMIAHLERPHVTASERQSEEALLEKIKDQIETIKEMMS